MALIRKAAIILSLGFVLLVGFYTVFTQSTIIKSYNDLEDHFSRQYVDRTSDQLDRQIDYITVINENWASWDATYSFMQDRNPAFLTTNFDTENLLGWQTSFVLLWDTGGEVVHISGVDIETGQQLPLNSQSVSSGNFKSQLLPYTGSGSSVHGLILFDGIPTMFALNPILDSDGFGPARGSLIFGRFLDDHAVAQLAADVGIPVSAYGVHSPEVPAEVLADTSGLAWTQKLDADRVASFRALEDIGGEPVIVLRTEMQRQIYRQARKSFTSTIIIFCVVGLLVVTAAIIFLQKSILSRVSRMVHQVSQIGKSGELSRRIEFSGSDEIASLGSNINGMLVNLETVDEELRQKNQELQMANTAKSDFLAQMSHELRTPLNAILGFSELMADEILGKLNKEQKGSVEDVISSGRHLLHLIDDVLDLSKIEAGKIDTTTEPVDLDEVVQQATREMDPILNKNGQQLSVENLPLSRPVIANRGMLLQIIANLLSNAAKFSPRDSRITVRAEEKDKWLEFSVTDVGLGIREADQGKIFEAFFQSETAGGKVREGTGLGLNICKQYIEAMGGRIRVTSTYGEGSTFTFTLPMAE